MHLLITFLTQSLNTVIHIKIKLGLVRVVQVETEGTRILPHSDNISRELKIRAGQSSVRSLLCPSQPHLFYTLPYCVLLYVLKQLQVTQIPCLPLINMSLVPHLQCRVGRISHLLLYSFFVLSSKVSYESYTTAWRVLLYSWEGADKKNAHTQKVPFLWLVWSCMYVSVCVTICSLKFNDHYGSVIIFMAISSPYI